MDEDLSWRVSSLCGNTTCVEVAERPDGSVLLRDNKNLDQPPLEFSPDGWSEFIRGIAAGEFEGGL